MKQLIKIVFVFFLSLITYNLSAQPGKFQKTSNRDHQFGILLDTFLAVPSDTFRTNVNTAAYKTYNWTAAKNNKLFLWNTSSFKFTSVGIDSIYVHVGTDSVFARLYGAEKFMYLKTAGAGVYVDTVYARNDTLFYKKNSTEFSVVKITNTETVQDAVGAMINASLQYVDATPLLAINDRNFGDITTSGSGLVWQINQQAVTYDKIQNITASGVLLGRLYGAGTIEELTGTDITTMLNVFTSTLKGIVPASGGGAVNFLRADGTWSSVPSTMNANVGTGYRLLKPGTQEIKTLMNGFAVLMDSTTNANSITFKADTSLLATVHDVAVLDLNAVLHNGNTSDQNILLTVPGAGDIAIQAGNGNGSGVMIGTNDDVGFISVSSGAGTAGLIVAPASGSGNQYYLPSASGTLALISDITIPNLHSVTTAGNSTSNSIISSTSLIAASGGNSSTIAPNNISLTAGGLLSSSISNIGFLTSDGSNAIYYRNEYVNFAGAGNVSAIKLFPTYHATQTDSLYLPHQGNRKDTLATLANVRAGGGGVSNFIFTDGNGFDGTVTSATTTPTLSLTTTVTNQQIMFSNSGAITGNAGFTYDQDLVTITESSLGETPTDLKGLLLANATAAADGAQQYSPSLRFQGYGWDDDNDVSKKQEIRVTLKTFESGTANDQPYPYLSFEGSINDSTYTESVRIYGNGTMSIGNGVNHSTLLGTDMPGVDGLAIYTNNSFVFRAALSISNVNGALFQVLNNGEVKVPDWVNFTVGINGTATISATNFLVNGGTTGLTMLEQSTASTPPSNYARIYPKADGLWYGIDDAGVETKLSNVSGSSGITIGTTTITSGTSSRILYNNAGVVGEKVTTGSGAVVLDTSPAITGGTLFSTYVDTQLVPISNDGATLGNSSLKFSDLYLASGAVINFNSSDFTLTHSSGTLTASSYLQATSASTTYKLAGSLKVNTTDVGNVGAGEDDLMTYSLPAGFLVNNGDYIEFTMTIKFASNANNKQVKLYFGSTNFYSSATAAQNDGTMEITGKIIRTGATTQDISFTVNSNTVSYQDIADYTSASETLSGALTLKATGTGTSNDDVLQKILVVKYFPGN